MLRGYTAQSDAAAHKAIKEPVPFAGEAHGYDYDLYVIGVGSAGMRATTKAKAMYNVPKVGTCEMPFAQISVDQRSIIGKNTLGGCGGTCVLRGCVPKKYFWYASHYKHELENAKGYGWKVENNGFDWKTLLEKKRKEIERLCEKKAANETKKGVDLHEGRGKLLDAHTIHISEPCNKTFTAKTILLATGTTPTVLKLPLGGEEHCISSDHILELEELPKKLAVIGAGYIACEFACMFAVWGCETHVIYRKDAPLTEFDDDCRYFIQRQMENLCGCKMHKLHTPHGVEKQANGKLTVIIKSVESGEEIRLTDFDDVLMATGRTPNTWELGLEAAGVAVTERGQVKVDEWSKTNVDNIYAIGDITDRMQLTPVAIQEAMNFLSTVYGGRPRKLDYSKVASAIFVQPPMGTCGLSEKEAVKKYPNLDVYMDGAVSQGAGWQAEIFTFTDSKEEMMVKVLVDADTDKVVGIHYVGKDAGEILQGFGTAMKMGCTREDLYDTVAIHPTSAEELVCIPGIDLFQAERQYRNGKLSAL
mmetsp:Transcript_76637/g.135214  ORF Transcript_76637/g.135214 Transcript_76637/m.135214 type:complete len:532 (+) Transcript_76637:63-1658(+)